MAPPLRAGRWIGHKRPKAACFARRLVGWLVQKDTTRHSLVKKWRFVLYSRRSIIGGGARARWHSRTDQEGCSSEGARARTTLSSCAS